MPWCARCGTGISQHEIVTDGYEEISHDSIYLRFPLTRKGNGPVEANEALLVWTTTPWTLTSNVAAAIGPDLTYVKVLGDDGWVYYLAKGAMETTLQGRGQVLAEMKGSELLGWEYKGPYDELPATREAFGGDYVHRVIAWDQVGEEEGTGIVHIAPGCGAEDFGLSKELNLPVIAPLDESGVYVAGFSWLSSRSVHDVAQEIFQDLREKGIYYRKQKYSHRYPHCWRCRSELVYRLVDEWFISMGELYDKPRSEVTAAEKQASLRYQIMDTVDDVTWHPSFGYDREMDWLRNMRDWMISKKRYWGLALPIWTCDDCGHHQVIGSEHELKEKSVAGWEEFEGHSPHRPYVDSVKINCEECSGLATRIPDVGNPWLDAGIVTYSTLHYRDDPEYWSKWFPADLITESFPGQFRNWFYSLLAQSAALTGRAPTRNLHSYATLLAEDGREMHKSWGNAIEFNEAANKMGADVMRWLYARHRAEQNLKFGFGLGDETRRLFHIPLWNVYSFLVTYANLDEWTPPADPLVAALSSPVQANQQLDRWIIARLEETVQRVTAGLEQFHTEQATSAAESLLDDLSNWYVRRSRRRFWRSEADADKQAAYSTLYYVLEKMVRLLAPIIPFTTEAIYQNLVRSARADAPLSIHLTDWPVTRDDLIDRDLLGKMKLAISVASLGRSARGSADIKLRQPLASAHVHVGRRRDQEYLAQLSEVLKEELNVKEITVARKVGQLVNYKLMPNNRLLGPRFGKRFAMVRSLVAELDPAAAASVLQAGQPLTVLLDGQETELSAEEILVLTESKGGLAVSSEKGVTVAVDTVISTSLRDEGFVRDLVRGINTLRRDWGLAIEDRILLRIDADSDLEAAFSQFADYLREEVLATSVEFGDSRPGDFTSQLIIDARPVKVSLQKS